jgi:hypothetical protein
MLMSAGSGRADFAVFEPCSVPSVAKVLRHLRLYTILSSMMTLLSRSQCHPVLTLMARLWPEQVGRPPYFHYQGLRVLLKDINIFSLVACEFTV